MLFPISIDDVGGVADAIVVLDMPEVVADIDGFGVDRRGVVTDLMVALVVPAQGSRYHRRGSPRTEASVASVAVASRIRRTAGMNPMSAMRSASSSNDDVYVAETQGTLLNQVL